MKDSKTWTKIPKNWFSNCSMNKLLNLKIDPCCRAIKAKSAINQSRKRKREAYLAAAPAQIKMSDSVPKKLIKKEKPACIRTEMFLNSIKIGIIFWIQMEVYHLCRRGAKELTNNRKTNRSWIWYLRKRTIMTQNLWKLDLSVTIEYPEKRKFIPNMTIKSINMLPKIKLISIRVPLFLKIIMIMRHKIWRLVFLILKEDPVEPLKIRLKAIVFIHHRSHHYSSETLITKACHLKKILKVRKLKF